LHDKSNAAGLLAKPHAVPFGMARQSCYALLPAGGWVAAATATVPTMRNLKRQPLPSHPDEVRMSFGEHLEDLRWRLLKALIGLAIGTGLCMAFASQIFAILIAPLQAALEANNFDAKMISTNPTEVMLEYFEMCLIFG